MWKRRALLLLAVALIASGQPLSQSSENWIPVNEYDLGEQTSPAVAISVDGQFWVTWISDSQDEGLPALLARRFSSSGFPLGGEIQVNTHRAPQDQPAIAAGGNGLIVIAWVDYWIEGDLEGFDKVSAGVSVRVFDAEGVPRGPEMLVNTKTDDFQGEPSVAMDKDGRFIVTWSSWGQDGDRFGIFARRFDANGQPLGFEFQVNNTVFDNQFHPRAAVNSDGDFMIVWSSQGQDGDETGIYARRYDRLGNPTGPEFAANRESSGWQDLPDIGLDDQGNAVICWQGLNDNTDDTDIFVRIFDSADLPLGPEFRAPGNSAGRQLYPSLACDRQGHFVIAWQSRQPAPNVYAVFARAFDASGQALGGDTPVGVPVQSRQERPDVAVRDQNSYSLVWQSWDVSNWNIYAQLFGSSTAQELRRQRHLIKRHEQKTNIHSPGDFPLPE